MISQDHPFYFLQPLFEKGDSVFRFSRYVYSPDTLFDERQPFEVEGRIVTAEWVEKTIETLPSRQELAFHSDAKIKGRNMHVPMIDFATQSLTEKIVDRLRSFLPREVFRQMAFFDSGRSFHAYSLELLAPKDWQDFMGRLLLINPKDGPDIVDSRWVGHRLIGKFSSLRWSNKSGLYAGAPKQILNPALYSQRSRI